MRHFALAVLSCWLLAAGAHADERLQAELTPIPWHVHGETAGNLFAPLHDEFLTAEADSEVYSNRNFVLDDRGRGYIFSPGDGVMFADDVHLLLPGKLTHMYLFYADPTNSVVRFTVSFYANDANDTSVGPLVGGPIERGPYRCPNVACRVHITLQNETIVLQRDLWFAAAVHSASAGLAVADPPHVGTSHDLYYDFAAATTAQFTGVPANFYLQIFVIPEALPVQQATWSAVKALFHPPHGGRGP